MTTPRKVLTLADLDELLAMEPEIRAITFHAVCHPRAGTWTSYQGGVATVRCRKCKGVVVQIAVAP